jgi:hypothetical protein
MTKQAYRREHKKLETERAQLQASLEKVRQKLAALELVWTEIFDHNQSTPGDEYSGKPDDDNGSINTSSTVAAANANANGHTGEWVEAAVQHFDNEFGVREVIAHIKAEHPDFEVNRSTVAGRLAKLVDERRLVRITAGKGRTPSCFRRVPA